MASSSTVCSLLRRWCSQPCRHGWPVYGCNFISASVHACSSATLAARGACLPPVGLLPLLAQEREHPRRVLPLASAGAAELPQLARRASRPDAGIAPHQRGWSLAREPPHEHLAQLVVLDIQMRRAALVGDRKYLRHARPLDQHRWAT